MSHEAYTLSHPNPHTPNHLPSGNKPDRNDRMTYRERREAKADRLREWADKREAKAQATREKVDEIAGMIPFGQPILVGHHSEGRARKDRDRIHNGMMKSIEDQRKAEEFRRRADSIEKAAEKSIYSDDDNAADQLRERIAALEAERDVKKEANRLARKGVSPNEWGLSDEQAKEAVNNFKHWPGGTDVPFPNLKNLSANIRRNKKRLADIREETQ